MIQAGAHDELITFLTTLDVQDLVGDELENWTTVTTEWAARRNVSANEIIRNPQIMSEVEVVFTIRYPDVILDGRMRIQDDDGRLYEIRGITPLEGRRTGFEIRAMALDRTGATIA